MSKALIALVGLIIFIVVGGLFFANQQETVNPKATVSPELEALQNASSSGKDTSMNDSTKSEKRISAPEMVIDKNKTYTATMKTSKGTITLELFASETPITVNNFVTLAREGFYDETKFHRIMKGFMIQGGDPLGNGTGGPGYKFDDEPIIRDYDRGIIAMANSGPNTNGSQFFIMHQDYQLSKDYVIFGQVTSGLDVVDAIANSPVKMGISGEKSVPTQDIYVTSVTIEEK